MPGGNKTGSFGEGPKTGRGLGFCSGSYQQGYQHSNANKVFGHGWGKRWGQSNHFRFRHRFGRFFDEKPANVSEVTLLENEARVLKEQIESIEKQIADMKKKTD